MLKLIGLLNRFSERCHAIGVIFLIPAMALIVTLNVVFRYFLNHPLQWGDEVNGMLLFMVLFLSMTYTWDIKKHIRMELIYVNFRGVWRTIADVIGGITGIIFFGCLAIQCIRDIPYMIKTSEASETLLIPVWPFRVVMILVSIVFVIKLIIYIFESLKGNEKEETVIEREGIVISKKGDE